MNSIFKFKAKFSHSNKLLPEHEERLFSSWELLLQDLWP